MVRPLSCPYNADAGVEIIITDNASDFSGISFVTALSIQDAAKKYTG